MALVIVLLFVSLFAVIGIAYVERASASRQIAPGGRERASLLAQSALNIVMGDLRQELAAAQADPPKRPWRNSGNEAHGNLLKRSIGGEAAYPGGVVRAPKAPLNSSTISSLNRRVIDAKRWNRSYLLARPETASPNDTTPEDFTPPDWVLVSRHSAGVAGSGEPAEHLSAMSDSKSPEYVIGRFAFLVFDEGGVLDVNAAGFPIGLSAAQVGRKGWLALSDLRQLGISAGTPNQIERIVGWRNFGVARPGRLESGNFYSYDFSQFNSVTRRSAAESFFEAVVSGRADPMRAEPTATFDGSTDQRFWGRLELLQFRRATGFSDRALQYLGTFSRELNQPSFAPDPRRAPLLGDTVQGGNDAFDPSDPRAERINPDFRRVRVAPPGFMRNDGSAAAPGQQLMGRRFALSRLAWVTFQGPSAANGGDREGTPENIRKHFGLQWEPGNQRWIYSHGSARPIALLEEVRDLGREPDFFELLKAGILAGSLGKCARRTQETGVYRANFLQRQRDGSLDRQILQIGANIIDQSDADSFPTCLWVPGPDWELCGSEDLPGFYRVHLEAVRVGESTGAAFMEPELWNPYDGRSSASGPRPTRFRITLETDGLVFAGPVAARSDALTRENSALEFQIADSRKFRHPTLVRDAGEFTPGPANFDGKVGTTYNIYESAGAPSFSVNTGSGATVSGFKVGTLGWSPGPSVLATLTAGNGLLLHLEFERNGWHPYQELRFASGEEHGLAMVWPVDGAAKAKVAVVCDPRTDRFGVAWARTDGCPVRAFTRYAKSPILVSGTNLLHESMRPDAGLPSEYATEFDLAENGGWSGDRGAFSLGCLSQNIGPGGYPGRSGGAQSCFYADADGVVRRAMGAYASGEVAGAPLAGLAMATPVVDSDRANRPFLLNRPFRNVAELGYVFRGTPWKNLDFFTPESGDRALLDLFCVSESKLLVGGRVSLNSLQPAVLKAVLAGAARDESNASFLGASESERLARALVAEGGIGNPAELVGVGDGTGFSAQLGSCYESNSSGSYRSVQRYRETALRALADVGCTRVWNLMVDLVAQTGRFPKGTTSLDGFVVEGEKRLWVHLAMDRYTGKILDRVVEEVSE